MSTLTEAETGTTASTSSVAVAVAASLNTVLETNSKESNGIITNDIDVPAPRTRSVFPTTDETRRSMYRSSGPKVIEYDSMTIMTEKSTDQVVRKTVAVTSVRERLVPSISPETEVKVEVEVKTKKEVRREDIENEFNHIMPEELTDAERYEERIQQLESAPLPCIDAITGLVHIVGKYMPKDCGVKSYLKDF